MIKLPVWTHPLKIIKFSNKLATLSTSQGYVVGFILRTRIEIHVVTGDLVPTIPIELDWDEQDKRD